ncbi:MAG: hypothetical protein ACPGES_06060 [Coraliomargarita sp.]
MPGFFHRLLGMAFIGIRMCMLRFNLMAMAVVAMAGMFTSD